MKFTFSHTYAVSSCRNCKKHSETSSGGPNFSLFYLVVAACMAVPWWAFATFGPLKLPWFDFPCYLAIELLLFFPIGFAFGWLSLFANLFFWVVLRAPVSRCPQCGSPLTFNGRYFKTGERANVDDIVLLAVYTAVNMVMGILAAIRTGLL